MVAGNTGRGIRFSSEMVSKVTTSRVLLIIRGHQRGIVVVVNVMVVVRNVVVALLVILGAETWVCNSASNSAQIDTF